KEFLMKDRACRTFLMRLTTSIIALGLVVIPHFSTSTDGRTHAGTTGTLAIDGNPEQTSPSQSTAIKPRPRDAAGETSTSSGVVTDKTPSHAEASSSCGTPYDTIPNF